MLKNFILFLAAAAAVLFFAGVRPHNVKQRIDSLTKSSTRTMMGADQDFD